MRISPDAKVDDGLFDICMVNDMSRLEILKFRPRVLSGGHKNHRAFEVLRGKHIKIEFNTPTMTQADGEVLGYNSTNFSIIPKALKVIRNNFTSMITIKGGGVAINQVITLREGLEIEI